MNIKKRSIKKEYLEKNSNSNLQIPCSDSDVRQCLSQ